MKQKSVFLMIAVLFGLRITATAQTPPAYVPTDGLVGWWPFNGNANDESGNGNNGTVNGATLTEDRFGSANAAYDFDESTEYIEVPYSNSLEVRTKFSISCWYKTTDDYVGSNHYPAFVGKERGCEGSTSFVLHNYNSSASIGVNNEPCETGPIGCTFYPCNLTLTGDSIHYGNWNHLVGVWSGDSLYLYQNSILLASGDGSLALDSLLSSEDPIFFAHAFSNSAMTWTDYFLGQLDDIGIWNRALTQEEITDLYNANLCYEYITVTDTLIINLNPTGFNPVTYANTILMYPNPTSEELTINYGDFASLAGYTLKIFDSIGQEIHSANINQQQEVLQLGSWGGAGTYQVVIYNAQGVPVDTRTIVLQD